MTITSEELTNFLTRSNCSIIAYLRLLSDILKANFQLLCERYISFTPFFWNKKPPENARIYKLVQKCFGIFSKKFAEQKHTIRQSRSKRTEGQTDTVYRMHIRMTQAREETAIADKTRSIEQLLNYFQKNC